jgi:26S proteasome regulatory subunit N7
MSKDATKKGKKAGLPSASDETAAPYPKMELCQQMHRLTTASPKDRHLLVDLQSSVFTAIAVDLENPSLYKKLREQLYGEDDEAMTVTTNINIAAVRLTSDELDSMQAKHDAHVQELELTVTDARENAGDMEVLEARLKIARFAAKSLSEHAALAAYQQVLDLPKLGSGKTIDALMEQARVASFYNDTAKADECIAKADKLANDGGGGDWDRRNRLKVYKALQRLLHRDSVNAASALLSCIATFSCNEICSYSDFIVYAILSNLLHLPRPALKSKILDGPEVLSVATDIPAVVRFWHSTGKYPHPHTHTHLPCTRIASRSPLLFPLLLHTVIHVFCTRAD